MNNIITVVFCSKTDLCSNLKTVLSKQISGGIYIDPLIKKFEKDHLQKLVDNLWVVIEYPYIDKVYRDSYYSYFSSKLNQYERDTIKLSFFTSEITHNDFRDETKLNFLQDNFVGFMVIRPTLPKIIGRSVLSPKVFINQNFITCKVKISTCVNSIKLDVEGFPHSSQDKETITCAETTIWALMEYLGTKYPEYKPTLPSKITDTLNKYSFERQIPSKGLTIEQISYALKEFGLGTRIYSEKSFGDEFHTLLSTYVESGIPIVIALSDQKSIGHAALCIGHSTIENSQIDGIPQTPLADSQLEIYESNKIDKEFIFIDDNHPPYIKASLGKPASNYTDEWKDCSITHFIVPHYTKVYLEAYEARKYVLNFLKLITQKNDNSEILIRLFLTSSRSFKNKVALNTTINEDAKDLILGKSMPKFIWIAELSTKELYKQKKANGMILLDATEANILNKLLIFAAIKDSFIHYEESTGILAKINLALNAFGIYESNLKN